MKKLLSFIALLLLFACNKKTYKEPHILIDTGFGDIEVELYPDKAPKTVAAFLAYIDSGYFKNSSFYRVVAEYNNTGLVQGGIWQTNNSKAMTIPGIIHESPRQTGLSHVNGTISLARSNGGTGSTEFFICVGDQQQFDSSKNINPDGHGFAAFGKVVNGMDVVKKIHRQSSQGEQFTEKVAINDIKKL
jgi:peptidyl-prolyl cis-trans isomerase A (cyclophilin A)